MSRGSLPRYIVQRILLIIPMMLVLLTLVFLLLRVAPGDPVSAAVGGKLDPAVIEARKAALGLDRPLLEQYARWLGAALRGDLGVSLDSQVAVATLLFGRLGHTLALLAGVFALITFAGFALALAGRLRAEATLAVANLIYIVVAVGGALVLPLSAYPDALQVPLLLLPSGALGESLRAAATGGFQPFLVLISAAWSAVALTVARKAFRWTS